MVRQKTQSLQNTNLNEKDRVPQCRSFENQLDHGLLALDGALKRHFSKSSICMKKFSKIVEISFEDL